MLTAILVFSFISGAVAAQEQTGHLLALYDFADVDGDVVRDRSGVGQPLDLKIEKFNGVVREPGSLTICDKTVIRSDGAAKKIIDAVQKSNELTIEVWAKPSDLKQEGPARVVSLSRDTSNRNFTLGQERDQWDFRLRTSRTSSNGIPSLPAGSKSARTELTHIVFARDRSGEATIYIDGKQNARRKIDGDFRNWDSVYRLSLGNELTGDRPWRGTLHLVAIYGRALSAAEAAEHFKRGPASEALQEQLAAARQERSTRNFHEHIAPLLVNHCFECHDIASNKGELDLSRKAAAFAGGESGPAIEVGKSAESYLWELVESDDMPKDREPLSDHEKQLLRQWIDDGANWPVEVIDPVVYRHGGRANDVFVQRLTVDEYIATVQAAVNVDIEKKAREILPADVRADGFNNTAYNLSVDLGHIEAYSQLAETIVAQMNVPKFAARFTKQQDVSDGAMRELIASMGRWLLRGPLDEQEVGAFLQIPRAVAQQQGDFDEASSYLIEAMLQSPRFIYRMERQLGDGSRQAVGQYELASRLSYIIWGAPPDEDLYRAAEAGELANESKLRQQVERMLRDPRAVARSQQFVSQWLHLSRLNNLTPDTKRFPHWNPSLAVDMREETLRYFEEIAWKQDRPLADLFNAQVTFATADLAKHYGLKPQGDGWQRYDLSGNKARGGLLTQGSVLTIGGNEASMVARGLFVLHSVLRGEVKDPPPCVDTTPIPTKEGLTQRSAAMGRIANNACGGCHSKFEPLAFGLEKFDGLGSFHEQDEHGNALRDDGEILFPGDAKPVKFESSTQLMNLLAESPRVQETMTWKLAQFSLGRPLLATDAAIVAKIHADAQAAGGTYRDLVTAIVMSDLVQTTRTEP